jgi:hypothetical protein
LKCLSCLIGIIALVSFGFCNKATALRNEKNTIPGLIIYPWVKSSREAVVVLCKKGNSCATFLADEDEPFAVWRAIEDVRGDLFDVTGEMFRISQTVPVRSLYSDLIIVGTVGKSRVLDALEKAGKIDLDNLRGKYESFRLQTVSEPFPGCRGALVIAGSDIRGTIYGTYTLTQDGLEVDPLRFWTERPVTKRSDLFLGPMFHQEPPPKIKYRGWFINDEDLLQGWHANSDRKVSAELYEHILSSALRLRQNMIIPQTEFNVGIPNDQRICEMVKDYGLLLTTHHAMPLGIWGKDWDIYWKAKGVQPPEFSFVKNLDKFEEIWRYGIDTYAPYMGIWQVGLRGKTDSAIWNFDKHFPTDSPSRAKVILNAISLQRRLLHEKLGSDVPVVTTLWTEVLDLYREGVLEYPEDITLIFSDSRGALFHFDDMGWKEPFPDGRAGVYYHLAFHNSHDSHLANTVHPYRIRDAFARVNKYNMTAYFLVNVGNIRDYVFGIEAVAEAAWTGNLDPEDYYRRWCSTQFGKEVANEVTSVYKRLFDLPYRWGKFEDEHFMIEGLIYYGFTFLDAFRQGKTSQEDFDKFYAIDKTTRYKIPTRSYMHYWPEKPSYKSVIDWFAVHCSEDSKKWDVLWEDMCKLEKKIPSHRRQFYRDNVLLQAFTMKAANNYMRDVARGLQAYLIGNKEETRRLLESAKSHLQSVLVRQKEAEHGKWAGFYENHIIVRFDRGIQAVEEFLGNL